MNAPPAPVAGPEPEVNSRAFWEARFTQSWTADHGPEQTRFFGDLALALIPEWLRRQVRQQRLSVCDWGCAFGEGTALLARGLDTALTGVDFSAAAIAQARLQFPALDFRCEDWLAGDPAGAGDGDAPRYDIVFSSNTLEHFDQPWAVFQRLAGQARRHVVLLLPFREPAATRYFEHRVSFEPAGVPLAPLPGWCLADAALTDLGPSPFWQGEQALLVYSRVDELAALRLSDAQCLAGRLAAPATREAAAAPAALAEALRQRDAHAAAVQLLLAENRAWQARWRAQQGDPVDGGAPPAAGPGGGPA